MRHAYEESAKAEKSYAVLGFSVLGVTIGQLLGLSD